MKVMSLVRELFYGSVRQVETIARQRYRLLVTDCCIAN